MELADEIEGSILSSTTAAEEIFLRTGDSILIIKYLPAEYLSDAITHQRLWASETPGFTWGDAIYVAPVQFPRTTMMYGRVGVVGKYTVSSRTRFFNAANPTSISLYQRWIAGQGRAYTELTTTVHSNLANRELRNEFRNRFMIDCVYFRPDEPCLNYVDASKDWWMAITSWDLSGLVSSGYSTTVSNLKWCVIGPESFKQHGRGFKPALHTAITASQSTYVNGHYSSLDSDIKGAYSSSHVVICDFN